MTDLETLLKSVLDEITPTPDEREKIRRVYEVIKNRLEEHLRRNNVSAEVTLQGSVAHDTWLRGDRDIDVFVLYPEDWSVADVKTKGFELIKEAVRDVGRVEIRYAEHPYIRLFVDDVEADIVPAYKLSSPSRIRTAVDRTPFHTEFVNSHLKGGLNNDVRLLKKFMKGIGSYGAEIKTKGFSGYAVELLVIAYGGFLNVLRAASEWRPPVYVNTLGEEGLFRRAVEILTKKYPDSVIYMPDPVDHGRNVTAAVSFEKLARFILASKCFLRRPSKTFFENRVEYDVEALERSLGSRCIVVVEVESEKPLPPEVVWGEVDRVRDRCVKLLSGHDFVVYHSSAWTDDSRKGVIVVELDECVKPAYKLYEGPPFSELDRVSDFISKHIGKSVKLWLDRDGRLMSISKRPVLRAVELLESKQREYLVSPHFKSSRPVIYELTLTKLREITSKYGEEFLRATLGKVESWLLECMS
ncbi:CCA tRNA nucleotidyltransferase [Thermogladius sp.]|uniref:CCA tRNA nucleotidyltransferase n=1 Tax=Thermogladius sp. TaxID=2023064 RepID=UPI003D0CBC5D